MKNKSRKYKVRREAQILRSLIQSAFVVRLAGLYESSLNSVRAKNIHIMKNKCLKNNVQVLVTEYLAGGDLVTRTAPEDYNLTERKCQIFIRQVTHVCKTDSCFLFLDTARIHVCFLFSGKFSL